MGSSAAKYYDALEQLIFDSALRIVAVNFIPEKDLMRIGLSSGATLRFRISAFARLHGQPVDALSNHELIAGGLGIHWPALDEDLSLKGFLQDAVKEVVGQSSA